MECIRLAWELAVADFKLRNEGSYLGYLWYFLHPLLLFLILYFVFAERLGADIENYAVYLIVGVLLFNFFMRTTIDATGSISSAKVIKSLNFPREALVLSVVLKHLLSHIFEVVIFFVALIVVGVSPVALLFYVVVLIPLAVFSYGIGLMLSAVTMRLVDLQNVWQFFIMLLWLGTPIFYQVRSDELLGVLNEYNPMYYFISAAREGVMYTQLPEASIVIGILMFPVIALFVGQFVFNLYKNSFAELI